MAGQRRRAVPSLPGSALAVGTGPHPVLQRFDSDQQGSYSFQRKNGCQDRGEGLGPHPVRPLALRLESSEGAPVTDARGGTGAKVRTVASVTQVDGADWDRLAASNPLLSHGWLQVAEEERPEEIRVYFLLETGGTLAGAAACRLETAAGRSESVDDLLLGRLRPTALGRLLSFRPSLVCGFPWSVGSGLLIDPDAEPPRRRQFTRLLVEAITRESSVRGCATAFLSVAEGESWLSDVLASRYEFVRHAPVYNLDLRWPSRSEEH